METLKTKRTDILSVDPRNIIVKDGFNIRQDMGDIEALSQSIVESGLQVPLKAKKVTGEDKYELVDGHRRLRAVMLAIENGHDIKFVEVMPFKGSEEDQVFSMIITGTGQKPLNEIEQSEAVKRLTNFGYTVEDIARKIGKSLPHVYNLLSLANAPKKIRDFVMSGLISGGTVVQIVREVKDEKEQLKVVEDAIADANKDTEKEGKAKKKATAKNVKTLKAKSPSQKIFEAIESLDEEGGNEEAILFLEGLSKLLKDGSVEDMVAFAKTKSLPS
jgi:ParB family transcriptional regulator, chromosome partitioning protein